jgi:hypothetical protein
MLVYYVNNLAARRSRDGVFADYRERVRRRQASLDEALADAEGQKGALARGGWTVDK